MTKRRLRDKSVLLDRDIDFVIQHCQGKTKAAIAAKYGVTERFVRQRLASVPPPIKDRIAHIVAECGEGHLTFIPDPSLEAIRRSLARQRRVEAQSDVGAL